MVTMSITPTPRTTSKRNKADDAARPRTEADDIVDRFIAAARAAFPDTDVATLNTLEKQLRAEFGGGQVYVRSKVSTGSLLDQLRTMFNGRNPAECARLLGCSRATVYRLVKTQGKPA